MPWKLHRRGGKEREENQELKKLNAGEPGVGDKM
jgi:hypothetical protein